MAAQRRCNNEKRRCTDDSRAFAEDVRGSKRGKRIDTVDQIGRGKQWLSVVAATNPAPGSTLFVLTAWSLLLMQPKDSNHFTLRCELPSPRQLALWRPPCAHHRRHGLFTTDIKRHVSQRPRTTGPRDRRIGQVPSMLCLVLSRCNRKWGQSYIDYIGSHI